MGVNFVTVSVRKPRQNPAETERCAMAAFTNMVVFFVAVLSLAMSLLGFKSPRKQ